LLTTGAHGSEAKLFVALRSHWVWTGLSVNRHGLQIFVGVPGHNLVRGSKLSPTGRKVKRTRNIWMARDELLCRGAGLGGKSEDNLFILMVFC
jgi:hypothetical protein